MPIGKKNKHHISRAIVPPIDVDPPLPANIPVIDIIMQPGKNKPCNINIERILINSKKYRFKIAGLL